MAGHLKCAVSAQAYALQFVAQVHVIQRAPVHLYFDLLDKGTDGAHSVVDAMDHVAGNVGHGCDPFRFGLSLLIESYVVQKTRVPNGNGGLVG